VEDRLVRCFSSVFPAASRDEITTQPFEAMPGWDSLRGVTLLAVLDEQFDVQMELPELLELGTFDALKTFLLKGKIG
jgi:acyl carrier protein